MKKLMIVLCLVFVLHLSATIINIPEDFDSIQDGLNFASEGDTILVAEGIYFENIIWPDIGDIKVIGVSRESTIIDGNYVNRVIDFDNDYNIIDENTLLKNLTIRNGFTQGGGAGIFCHNSKPSLINLIITNNESVFRGGGIMCFNYSHTIIENVIFSNNTASEGGAINCDFSSNALLINCKLLDNVSESCGGGIVAQGGSNIDVYNGLIYNNSATHGGAAFVGEKGTIDLINCTIVENYASEIGGVICSYGDADLINCIIWDNSTPIFEGFVDVEYSDTQEDCTGVGNIELNPLFSGTTINPFSLQDISPCVNAGIPDTTGLNLPEYDLAGNPRFYGGRIEMGAYENQNVVVNANSNTIPNITKLSQNYPNPFNPSTTINFSIKNDSNVELSIYNLKGQKIKILVQDEFNSGDHSIMWDGDDESNKPVSSGVYYYQLQVGNEIIVTEKCLLLK
ncbi:MAG: T9SS type A sorting domain-containing protein [Candidatus Tenebribacter mawsonii]|nr:T9SS type A sorting domain-containing protein [Candidatus Tenebribacter mawsonii]